MVATKTLRKFCIDSELCLNMKFLRWFTIRYFAESKGFVQPTKRGTLVQAIQSSRETCPAIPRKVSALDDSRVKEFTI